MMYFDEEMKKYYLKTTYNLIGYSSNFTWFDVSKWTPISTRGGKCNLKNHRGGQCNSQKPQGRFLKLSQFFNC